MKKLALFCLIFIVLSCKEKNEKETKKYLSTNKKEIQAMFNGQKFPFSVVNEDLFFPYTGKTNEVGFYSENDSVKFKLAPKDSIPLTFVINKKDSISVLVIGKSNSAEFSDAYIQKQKGKYKVYAPKVHELVNIAIALTEVGAKDNNMIPKGFDYYERVMAYFEPYKSHPLIDSLNNHITEAYGMSGKTYEYYYNIRMNANIYSYKDGKIVNDSPYKRMSFGEDNYLNNLLPLLEDFSEKSKFNEFYKANETYYKSLIDDYYKLVPVDKMWQWIENKFLVKHDSYKIYFSPLVGGAHSTKTFKDNGFSETLMFVNGPTLPDQYSEKEKEAILSRIVFTEIDHNYVNPTTNKYPEINSLLKPLNCWNKSEQGYGSSYATFNEYMTWSVFTLYLYDNFNEEVFNKRNTALENFMMSKSRGFIKFKSFNRYVLDWYKKNPNVSLEKLYPEVIQWIKKQECNK